MPWGLFFPQPKQLFFCKRRYGVSWPWPDDFFRITSKALNHPSTTLRAGSVLSYTKENLLKISATAFFTVPDSIPQNKVLRASHIAVINFGAKQASGFFERVMTPHKPRSLEIS